MRRGEATESAERVQVHLISGQNIEAKASMNVSLATSLSTNMRVLFRESYGNERETVYVKSEGERISMRRR